MAEYITYDLIHHIIYFQLVLLLIAISNIWIMHRARRHPASQSVPFVSILVPARNEEENIADCVHSLISQEYPSFEVLVLDDQSTDNTLLILHEIASHNSSLTVIEGKPAPRNQIGKNWACAQLAEQAKGDLFLFTDADTIHEPGCLKSIINAIDGEKADLLTGFPRQQVQTWGERLLVPFFSWATICFNPLWIAYWFRLPILSSAVGQMMLFRREAYFKIGGHAGISDSIVDDLALVRQINSHGLRWRVVSIADQISSRMYHNSKEAYTGFVKNLFAAFNYRLLPFFFVFAWLFVMFWGPIIVLILAQIGFAGSAERLDILLCIGISILLWLLPYLEIKLPMILALFYPVTVLANIVVAFQSARLTIAGKIDWKGRPIAKQKWTWL
ncbi:MAG: glycosyltransferase [Aliifodinibius sp.]|nr:glycosyltransferase [Candidatus Saccharibacteria bacterium]NIT56971.1 glycosyltransferase [Fodinibius sp.]NIV11906.1 glycosyltransferase [Fodinibius sp.]NIY25554.1 glycosyltransferase [Fodinibius sp.]